VNDNQMGAANEVLAAMRQIRGLLPEHALKAPPNYIPTWSGCVEVHGWQLNRLWAAARLMVQQGAEAPQ